MDVELSILVGSIVIFLLSIALATNKKSEISLVSLPRGYRRRSSQAKTEKRLHLRHETTLRAKYRTHPQGIEDLSWIKDISRGGVRLFLNKTFAKGTSLKIEIKLPFDAKPMFFQGNIVWAKGDDAGFSFSKAAHVDVSRIIEYSRNRKQMMGLGGVEE